MPNILGDPSTGDHVQLRPQPESTDRFFDFWLLYNGLDVLV
jgi:hypothetical protein